MGFERFGLSLSFPNHQYSQHLYFKIMYLGEELCSGNVSWFVWKTLNNSLYWRVDLLSSFVSFMQLKHHLVINSLNQYFLKISMRINWWITQKSYNIKNKGNYELIRFLILVNTTFRMCFCLVITLYRR